MATIQIPEPLWPFTGGNGEVAVPGKTVLQVLRNLDRKHPGIGARLLDPHGGLVRHLNVFRNDADVRALEALDTPVRENDRISIVSAIAGGSALGWA